MKNSIAQTIVNSNVEYNDALNAADWDSVDEEQDFENETTTFVFTDGSKLVFCALTSTIEIH